MTNLPLRIAKLIIVEILNYFLGWIVRPLKLVAWYLKTGCSYPIPPFIKRKLLLRHGSIGSTWVETGTFVGQTTRYLAKNFPVVHTIEASKECIIISKILSKRYSKKIRFHEGTSEKCLDGVCSLLSGNVCFWLDAHYSSGITYRGEEKTSISSELKIIEKNLKRFDTIVVIIDDILACHLDSNYPSLDNYVDWARKNNLHWHIEHDIFIAKSRQLNIYKESALPD